MTYTEIMKHVYSSNDRIDERINSLEEADRRAWRVIQLLDSRRGFGGWWEPLDPEIQDEIFNELRALIGPPSTAERLDYMLRYKTEFPGGGLSPAPEVERMNMRRPVGWTEVMRSDEEADDSYACPKCKSHMAQIGVDLYRCTNPECRETWEARDA